MKFAIPSYRRAKVFEENTLAYLKEVNFDLTKLDVFLSDEKDLQDYSHISGPNFIITRCKNVREKFNFIHTYYTKGCKVVVLEDDITLIDKNKQVFKHFMPLCKAGFKAIRKKSIRGGIWAVNPSGNHFFIQNKITSDSLKLCVAHCYGFISEPESKELLITQLCKSDYERTLRYYCKYGFVVRADYCGVKTKSYKTPGGMQAEDFKRAEIEKRACDYLHKNSDGLMTINFNRKSSIYPELKIKNVRNYSSMQRKKILKSLEL
jgi:hypothetical protein